MVTSKGIIQSETYNNETVIKGNKKIWFLNGDLVRLYHSSRSTGLVSVYNITIICSTLKCKQSNQPMTFEKYLLHNCND